MRTTGRPVALAIPKAKKAAERSSKTGMVSIWFCWAKAMVRGVERDPGQMTAVVNPRRFKVSARMEAQTVLVLRKSMGITSDRVSGTQYSGIKMLNPSDYRRHLMILEAVMLNVKLGLEDDFETAFKKASTIISSMDGYLSHELHRCLEVKSQYLLLVRWENLESHTIGFRESAEYQQWKILLHHFYEPFPTVEHFQQIELDH